MARPGAAIWIAWGLALLGGLAVLGAAYLVARVDLAAGCLPTAACSDVLPSGVVPLAIGGTAAAVVGVLVAMAMTVRRFARRPPPTRQPDARTPADHVERSAG